MKIYDKKHPSQALKINLKGAKIDDLKEQEFMVICAKDANEKRSIDFYFFKASNNNEALDWMTAI